MNLGLKSCRLLTEKHFILITRKSFLSTFSTGICKAKLNNPFTGFHASKSLISSFSKKFFYNKKNDDLSK